MLEILTDTLIDGIKLLPFLFITYLLMEYIEHKMGKKSKKIIQKSGKYGPILGGVLGIFPQCGFSAAAASLYAGRVITLGTMIAIFLSTSDEMLPILISETVEISVIAKISAIKLAIGILAGLIIDAIVQTISKKQEEKIKEVCEHEHCHCNEEGVFKSAIKHTIHIFIFLIITTLIINIIIHFIGEDTIAHFIQNQPILGPVIAGIVGLIPNCASSVILTKLYLAGLIPVATMLAGLLVGAGVGILVLFRTNKSIKENSQIVGLLYIIGVFTGIVLQLLGLQI